MGLSSEVTQNAGDRFLWSDNPCDRDGKVSEGGHHARPASLADSTAIFVEGHVSDVVSCLDVPVAPNDLEQFSRPCLVGR